MANLIVAWKKLRDLKNWLSFSMQSVQIQNIPPRYLNHRSRFKPLAFKNIFR